MFSTGWADTALIQVVYRRDLKSTTPQIESISATPLARLVSDSAEMKGSLRYASLVASDRRPDEDRHPRWRACWPLFCLAHQKGQSQARYYHHRAQSGRCDLWLGRRFF